MGVSEPEKTCTDVALPVNDACEWRRPNHGLTWLDLKYGDTGVK